MSTPQSPAERSKFDDILRLSRDQVRALETNDMATFNRALAAKRTLIGGLGKCQSAVAEDPTLMGVISQIEDSEKFTEELLFRRIGRIKRELDEIHQFNNAKRAYKKTAVKMPRFVRDPETPRLFDAHS